MLSQGRGALPGAGAAEAGRGSAGPRRENPEAGAPVSWEARRSQGAGLPYCGGRGRTWRSGPHQPGVSAAPNSVLQGLYGNARSSLRRAAAAKQNGRRSGRATRARAREGEAGLGMPRNQGRKCGITARRGSFKPQGISLAERHLTLADTFSAPIMYMKLC